MMDAFAHEIASFAASETNPAIVAALADVCSLFGLGLVEKHLADLLADGFLTPTQARAVRQEVASGVCKGWCFFWCFLVWIFFFFCGLLKSSTDNDTFDGGAQSCSPADRRFQPDVCR
jgi:hypothetical protein